MWSAMFVRVWSFWWQVLWTKLPEFRDQIFTPKFRGVTKCNHLQWSPMAKINYQGMKKSQVDEGSEWVKEKYTASFHVMSMWEYSITILTSDKQMIFRHLPPFLGLILSWPTEEVHALGTVKILLQKSNDEAFLHSTCKVVASEIQPTH